ncbi:amidohydrolase family protein [Aromatoleum petrolei]|uniref:Amidohydrolase family protein n=1 Tax=Aromatoleum petrolei TaxID=76116 RepID=A0ABX1MPM8_9RHOO|nr:amidohydrolase family protein [Aromatoleum petrolei]NMF88603.1 amidohydrolase family protein [Aromatoleum petrolei]QTQ34689.1 Putative 2-amino-3-carboxymuconate-6-semialdehyde decarboxylase [Aromatoleum petrolei]
MAYDYRVIDVDQHLEHAPKVWAPYVPEEYRSLVTETVWGIGMGHVYDLWINMQAGRCRPMDIRPLAEPPHEISPGAHGDYKDRLREMDLDGISATLLYCGTPVGGELPKIKHTAGREAYLALIRGFNDWLSDFCAPCPERLFGVALIPGTNVDDAIAELRRVRKLPGIKCVVNLGFPSGQGKLTADDDPFWAEALNLGMPITIHGSVNGPWWARGIADWTKREFALWNIGRIDSVTGGPLCAAELIISGLFDRFPELMFSISECGASWVPYFMCNMDHYYYKHRYWGGFTELKHAPSEYIRRGHLQFNTIFDPAAIRLRDEIGLGNINYSSDFPHVASDWPESQKGINAMLDGAPLEVRDAILWKNAARWLHL